MHLHFLGANRQVTGSRYLLEAAGKQVLIDCGMFQEREFLSRNWQTCPIPPSEIEAMLLTHAHLDHCGLIPRLVREGYRGPIYCTPPTTPLADLILRDSAKIQSEDADYKKARHAREGRSGPHPEDVLYSEQDVSLSMPLFRSAPYRKPIAVTEAISVIFYDAGHILGSAMLELQVTEGNLMRRILFSGDIGQWNKPLIRDPTLFDEADFVVMESTYGDRDHENGGDVETQLETVIHDTVSRGGNVVIPTFAVERAQELLFHLSRLIHANRIPDLPVYLDSPMSVDATEIFRQFPDCFDAETWQLIRSNASPLKFPGLRHVPNGRRIESHQPRQGLVRHHGQLRNVQRRTHQTSPEAKHQSARIDNSLCRVPEPWNARAIDPGWPARRTDSWAVLPRQSEHRADLRVLRPC